MQQFLGVTPDMTVVAKAMSNGFPMGAVVGARKWMEPAARMFISSSYWSDNVGLAASITTIRELKRRNSAARFNEIGEKLRAAFNRAIAGAGLEGACTGLAYNVAVSLTAPAGVDPRKISTLFVQEMARRKIYTNGTFKATLAHTDADIQQTGAAAAEALAVIKSGLDQGDLDRRLVVDLKKEPFRRQVR
jgi:glutamate-1-semialdehyde aminotransferase